MRLARDRPTDRSIDAYKSVHRLQCMQVSTESRLVLSRAHHIVDHAELTVSRTCRFGYTHTRMHTQIIHTSARNRWCLGLCRHTCITRRSRRLSSSLLDTGKCPQQTPNKTPTDAKPHQKQLTQNQPSVHHGIRHVSSLSSSPVSVCDAALQCGRLPACCVCAVACTTVRRGRQVEEGLVVGRHVGRQDVALLLFQTTAQLTHRILGNEDNGPDRPDE
mmetsp:Transcript_20679/g.50435  ORF Transcript_20679/g.50435 Transcript_20679/m.50435 type:complete len:218 (-) Transcript_20679:1479-2132(-)